MLVWFTNYMGYSTFTVAIAVILNDWLRDVHSVLILQQKTDVRMRYRPTIAIRERFQLMAFVAPDISVDIVVDGNLCSRLSRCIESVILNVIICTNILFLLTLQVLVDFRIGHTAMFYEVRKCIIQF